jgi:flagellar hook-associated protein 3 FlgL
MSTTIRATTNGVLQSYRANLNASVTELNKARDTVLTQRNFNSFGEDPAAATQAFKLRRSWHRVDAEYTVNQSTTLKFDSAWSTLESISDMIDTNASNSALTAALNGNNDPAGSGRNALGQELTQLADSIVQAMNTRYGDNYIFSGADGQTVPFTWNEDGSSLLYRGVDVTTGEYTIVDENDPDNPITKVDISALDALSNETNYVDIGLGMQLDSNGNAISSSVFNDSLPGINYLGYGTDKDGDSENLVVLIKRMGTILSNCDANGNWASDEESEEFNRLINKLEDASTNFKSNLVQLDTQASFLSSNGTQLLTAADTINEQFLEIEQCDLADAITSFSWAQYCYNAALKVGNSILSQSLMDYMD